MAKFYTRFNPPPSPSLKCEVPSLARQEFKDESDINNIIKRYETTGYLVDPEKPGTLKPQFGDFSNLPSRQQMYDKMIEAEQAFQSLPVDVRRRFHWNPAELLDFIYDERNRDEAVKLGLIEKPVEPIIAPEPSKEASEALDATSVAK